MHVERGWKACVERWWKLSRDKYLQACGELIVLWKHHHTPERPEGYSESFIPIFKKKNIADVNCRETRGKNP